jgi:ParB-like nuclease domain
MSNRALHLVPSEWIKRSPSLAASAKGYRDVEFENWMLVVPSIVDLKARGATSEDFDRMRSSSNPVDRTTGDTEYALFRSETTAIKASYSNRNLELTGGRHRMEAAQRLGVQEVPVRVWATNEEHSRLTADLEHFRAQQQKERDQVERNFEKGPESRLDPPPRKGPADRTQQALGRAALRAAANQERQENRQRAIGERAVRSARDGERDTRPDRQSSSDSSRDERARR